jgi:hypothetical protein
MKNRDRAPSVGSRDPLLFSAHDVLNALIFLFVFGLPYVGSGLLVQDYVTGKTLHLFGLLWFYGGLILSSFVVSRFVWMQPSLDHDKLAYGYRFILVLECFCIPSIALMAYGGMAMVTQLGGLEAQPWTSLGYRFLLISPPILMITPRLVHKRLIKSVDVDIERERRLAFWMDWIFIVVMTLIIGSVSVSMLWKVSLF